MTPAGERDRPPQRLVGRRQPETVSEPVSIGAVIDDLMRLLASRPADARRLVEGHR